MGRMATSCAREKWVFLSGAGLSSSVARMVADGCASGHASVYSRRGKAVVDNTEDGFSIVGLSTASLILALPARVSRRVPKQVVWADNYKAVVGGSDHGKVYVYDAETARVMGALHHDKDGLVQTVAVRDPSGSPRCLDSRVNQVFDGRGDTLIFGASSAYPVNFSPFVSVWQMKPMAKRRRFAVGWPTIFVLLHVYLAFAAIGVFVHGYLSQVSHGSMCAISLSPT